MAVEVHLLHPQHPEEEVEAVAVPHCRRILQPLVSQALVADLVMEAAAPQAQTPLGSLRLAAAQAAVAVELLLALLRLEPELEAEALPVAAELEVVAQRGQLDLVGQADLLDRADL